MATTLNLTITMIGSDIAYCKVIAGNIDEIIRIYQSQSGHTVSVNNNYSGYDIYIDGTSKAIVRDSNFEYYYSPPSNYIQFKAALKNGYSFKINYLYTDSSSISSSNDTLYANFISSQYNATFNTTNSGSGGGDSGGGGGGDSGGSSGGIDYGFYVGGNFCRIYIYDNNVKRQVAIKVNGKYLGRKT